MRAFSGGNRWYCRMVRSCEWMAGSSNKAASRINDAKWLELVEGHHELERCERPFSVLLSQ